MMRSRSVASRPATARASREAWTLRVAVVSSSAAMRRSRMPVRLTIHSSEVSTIVDSSSLVMTRDGAYIPQPVISAFVVIVELLGRREGRASSGIDFEERLLPFHQGAALHDHAGHGTGHIGLDLVEELHRLDEAHDLAAVDLVTFGDVRARTG